VATEEPSKNESSEESTFEEGELVVGVISKELYKVEDKKRRHIMSGNFFFPPYPSAKRLTIGSIFRTRCDGNIFPTSCGEFIVIEERRYIFEEEMYLTPDGIVAVSTSSLQNIPLIKIVAPTISSKWYDFRVAGKIMGRVYESAGRVGRLFYSKILSPENCKNRIWSSRNKASFVNLLDAINEKCPIRVIPWEVTKLEAKGKMKNPEDD